MTTSTEAKIHEFVKFDREIAYRVVNTGDRDVKLEYEYKWITIPAGSERFVPADAIMVWFGHPGARDISDREKYRTEEWLRMQSTYNDWDGDQRFFRFPDVEVYHPNGERIMTVIDDPEGKHLLPWSSDEAGGSDTALLQRQIDQLQQTLAAMQTAQTNLLAADQPTDSTEQQPDVPSAPAGDSVVGGNVQPNTPPVDGANVVKVGPGGRAKK